MFAVAGKSVIHPTCEVKIISTRSLSFEIAETVRPYGSMHKLPVNINQIVTYLPSVKRLQDSTIESQTLFPPVSEIVGPTVKERYRLGHSAEVDYEE